MSESNLTVQQAIASVEPSTFKLAEDTHMMGLWFAHALARRDPVLSKIQ